MRLLALLLLFSLLGCAPPPEPKSAAPAPARVETVHPHRGEIWRYVNLPGQVRPLYEVTLFAKVDGYLAKLHVDKGDFVKKGDLLAEIEVPQLRAQREKFKADVELAEAELQGTKPDASPGQNKFALAKARASAAKANLDYTDRMLEYARITAPFDGAITRRYVDPGAYIPIPNAADTPEAAAIVNLTDFDILRMQVEVPELEVPRIKLGLPVRWTTDALPGEHFDGTVTRAYWSLNHQTRTMLTEVQLTNRNRLLRPGMLVNARIALERKENTLLIPAEALILEKLGAFVFTVKAGHARKRPVKVGFQNDEYAEITAGLKVEDFVVLPKGESLRDGQALALPPGTD